MAPSRFLTSNRLNFFLRQVLAEFMENPLESLTWLDLSHNQLDHIPDCLTKFTNLTVLYLHGNRIIKVQEVAKLKVIGLGRA